MTDIPRRLSVRDKGYDHKSAIGLVISLDGVEQNRVMAYDIDAGTVTRQLLNEKGNAQLDPSTGRVWIETVEGAVEVIRKP